MKKSSMMCPLCKDILYSEETFQYEDAALYVITSDKWTCQNTLCKAHKSSYWNDYGDYFSDHKYSKDSKYLHNSLFPDGRYAAYNSLAKQHEIEIYRKGLKQKIYLPKFLTLWTLQPFINCKYKANKMGTITKRYYKLEFLYRDRPGKDYNIYYYSKMKSLFYVMGKFRKKYKAYKKEDRRYSVYALHQDFILFLSRDDWHNRMCKNYINIFYPNLIDTITEKHNFVND